jgi:hypothetical protein
LRTSSGDRMLPQMKAAKLPPLEVRFRNTAYLVLLMSWAFLAAAALMIVLLLTGHPMLDRESGRPAPVWLELLIATVLAAVGVALNRFARWAVKQYRAGGTPFGTDP